MEIRTKLRSRSARRQIQRQRIRVNRPVRAGAARRVELKRRRRSRNWETYRAAVTNPSTSHHRGAA